MNKLTNDDKLFCETFVKTFDFDRACTESSTNPATMLLKIGDVTDSVNISIRNSIDSRKVANSFFTNELVKSELIKILMGGDDQYKLQSSKLLLSLEDSKDKTDEFMKLIEAVKSNKEI